MNGKRTVHVLRLLVLPAVLALAACGTATPYQPARDGYGYAEQALEEDRYRVTFIGNSLTPRETVENYLLYRAAEVTLARGFDYFIVVNRDTERDTTYHSTVTGIGTGLHRDRYDYGVSTFGTATARPISQYAAYANIILRKGRKSPDDRAAYNARDVLKRLGPTIRRAPPS